MLANLTNAELLLKTKLIATNERKIQVELLWHLLEIQKRKVYLDVGFPSLYDYVVKELGYGHGAAYRRIQAMRLLESVPGVAEKIEEGSINLSTASQVQNFIKSEKKNGGNVSYKQRVQMIQAIENKSTRDVEKHLIALKPENVVRPEKVRSVTADIVEMRLMIPEELKSKLDHLRFYFSHVNPDMTYIALIEYLANKALLQIERKANPKGIGPGKQSSKASGDSDKNSNREILKKEETVLEASETSIVDGKACQTPASRFIPSALRQAVWVRDGGRCSYQDPTTGNKCGARYLVQVDHIHPWSQGGENKLENLQLLCAQHNRHKGNRVAP